MPKCIVMCHHEYLTPRRATGSMYVDRTSWSEDIEDAKVFANKSAAVNSARANLGPNCGFDVLEVGIIIKGVL